MDTRERIREAANLRFAFQSKSRLRLEFLGELSKILRTHGEEVRDDVLASLVVAVPEELATEGGWGAPRGASPSPRPPGAIQGAKKSGKKRPPEKGGAKKGTAKKGAAKRG